MQSSSAVRRLRVGSVVLLFVGAMSVVAHGETPAVEVATSGRPDATATVATTGLSTTTVGTTAIDTPPTSIADHTPATASDDHAAGTTTTSVVTLTGPDAPSTTDNTPTSSPPTTPPLRDPNVPDLQGTLFGPDGRGVAGICIWTGGPGEASDVTDANGHYELAHVERGVDGYMIGPQDCSGSVPSWAVVFPARLAVDSVPAVLNLAIERTAAIDGYVVDQHGDPIPDVWVTTWLEAEGIPRVGVGVRSGHADPTGHFAINGLAPGLRIVWESGVTTGRVTLVQGRVTQFTLVVPR